MDSPSGRSTAIRSGVRRLITVFTLLSLPALAGEVLTNADVVKLVQAGLSLETIVAKIEATPSRFDVSTDALVALTKDGVPDGVIRAMIVRGSEGSPAAPGAAAPAPAPPAVQEPAPRPKRTTTKRYDVAVHRSEHARCEGAELRVDGRGVKSSRCRGLDFDLTWSAIERVCHDYGFRGTIVFFTATGEHRVSTTTPAEARSIVEHVRGLAPGLAVAACRGD